MVVPHWRQLSPSWGHSHYHLNISCYRYLNKNRSFRVLGWAENNISPLKILHGASSCLPWSGQFKWPMCNWRLLSAGVFLLFSVKFSLVVSSWFPMDRCLYHRKMATINTNLYPYQLSQQLCRLWRCSLQAGKAHW